MGVEMRKNESVKEWVLYTLSVDCVPQSLNRECMSEERVERCVSLFTAKSEYLN